MLFSIGETGFIWTSSNIALQHMMSVPRKHFLFPHEPEIFSKIASAAFTEIASQELELVGRSRQVSFPEAEDLIDLLSEIIRALQFNKLKSASVERKEEREGGSVIFRQLT